MDWKRFLGAVALVGCVASPAFAQTGSDFTDLDDITVPLEDVTQPRQSRVDTVDRPTEVGSSTLSSEEERSGAESHAVHFGSSTHYVIDPAALDDGVITQDELILSGTPIGSGERSVFNSQSDDLEVSSRSDGETALEANPFVDAEIGQRIEQSALRTIDTSDLERFAGARASNVSALQAQVFEDIDSLRTSGVEALSSNRGIPRRNLTVLNQRLTAIDNELTNLELAYGELGDQQRVARITEVRRGVDNARNGLSVVERARNPGEFHSALDGLGASVSTIAPSNSSNDVGVQSTGGTQSLDGIPSTGPTPAPGGAR